LIQQSSGKVLDHSRIRTEVKKFFREFAFSAHNEKRHDRAESSPRWHETLYPHKGGPLSGLDKLWQKLHNDDEWQQHEKDLLAVAEQQAEIPAIAAAEPSLSSAAAAAPEPPSRK